MREKIKGDWCLVNLVSIEEPVPVTGSVYEYVIHIHIHSSHSDGSLTIEDIAGLAKKAGLNAVVITDHGTLKGLDSGQEGYYKGVLVLVGMEVNQYSHHYLALGVQDEVTDNEADPQQVIDEVNRQGGFGIIAHPFDRGFSYPPFSKSYPWTNWSVRGFQAIEVWNELSQWSAAWFAAVRKPVRALALLLNPLLAVRHPEPHSIRMWDKVLAKGQVVFASAGSDAHGITIRLGSRTFRISPYERGLKTLNTHILCSAPLSGKYLVDKDSVLKALGKGWFWLANDRLADSSGFSLRLRDNSQIWLMGDRAPYSEHLELLVTAPRRALVKVLKNGRLWRESIGKNHRFTSISPAIYRIEVQIKRGGAYYTWIVSNPIWVVEPLSKRES